MVSYEVLDMIFLNLFDRLIKKKDVYYKYSTEEQFTGEYWIDGKKIYCKTISFDFPSSTSLTTLSTAHNISNFNELIKYEAKWYDTSDTRWYFISRYDLNTDATIKFGVTATNFVAITSVTNWNSRTSNRYVTIFFTKTTG